MGMISVIIPTRNRRELLARTLHSLMEQDFPRDLYEIVVVVDGSTDDSAEMAKALPHPVRLVVIEQAHRGQAAAMNAGIRSASGELVLFIDDDILCGPSLLREHAAAHASGAATVAFGPVVIEEESRTRLSGAWVAEFYERYQKPLEGGSAVRWPTDARIEANRSLPRRCITAAGGFDESFSGEAGTFFNVELGLRLWKQGVAFHYLPNAQVRQIYDKRPRAILREGRQMGRGEARTCALHPEYWEQSVIALLLAQKSWKGVARNWLARRQVSAEALFAAPCWVAKRCYDMGIMTGLSKRVLQAGWSVAWEQGASAQVGGWKTLEAMLQTTGRQNAPEQHGSPS